MPLGVGSSEYRDLAHENEPDVLLPDSEGAFGSPESTGPPTMVRILASFGLVLALAFCAMGPESVAAQPQSERGSQVAMGKANPHSLGVAPATLAEYRAAIDLRRTTGSRSKAFRPIRVINKVARYIAHIHLQPSKTMFGAIDSRRAVVSAKRLVLRGRCNPKDPYSPGLYKIEEGVYSITETFCFRGGNGSRRFDKSEHPPYIGDDGKANYQHLVNGLSRHAALSARLPLGKVGSCSKIIAFRKRATFFYAKSADAERTIGRIVFIETRSGRILTKKHWQ